MPVSRTFKRSGLLTLAAVALLAIPERITGDGLKALGVVLVVFAGSTFLVSATRHVARRLLWRVGSRLLVSYLLIGVVPIPFLAALAYLGCVVIAGQLSARRVETALVARQVALEETALELLPGFRAAAAAERRRLLAEKPPSAAHGAGWAFVAPDGTADGEGPLEASALLPREWLATGRYAGRVASRDMLAGAARSPAGTLLLYVPVDGALEQSALQETGVLVTFPRGKAKAALEEATGEPSVPDPKKKGLRFKVGSREVDAEAGRGGAETPGADGKPALEIGGPIHGRWVGWVLPFSQPLLDWESGQPLKGERVFAFVRTSLAREATELFAGTRFGSDDEGKSLEAGALVTKIMLILGSFVLLVYVVAALLAALLVTRIARATNRLSLAFAEVEKGNFAHRAVLKGHDQLARLIASFNDMAAHLSDSVAAKAEKERLRQELEVARQLQRRLLPPATFAFPGVEIATDFRPAAEIGGDFYHFAGEEGERLVVVVADVSGHGLPTGIVMASAKAALAVLSSAGTPTARIFETLDREVRETTDARTFVTLAHVRFRLKDQELDFTNAGHVYPYRISAEGEVTSVANPARPLGVVMPGTFRTVTATTSPADLWVLLSDGIVEAQSPEGEPFGFERLEKVLATGAGGSAASLRDTILTAWRSHTGRDEPEDDRTLVVLRIA